MPKNDDRLTGWGGNVRSDSRRRKCGSRSGNAVIEVAFLAPWIFFLFAAVLDFGFFAYAAIAVENAARVAALRVSDGTAGDPSVPPASLNAMTLAYACQELIMLPNVGSSCPASVLSATASVSDGVSPYTTPDAQAAVRVSITYTSISMIPLPFMRGQWAFTRIAQVKI